MATVVRDSRFSMSVIPPVEMHYAPMTQSRSTKGKRIGRQLVNLWKMMTRTRSKQRASFMPRDFVSVTRRRSTMPPQLYLARA
ncbi:hypothetical protein EST38_g4178 [Candolleomyces aberdarensis]|uniref:Uncharacterized protein n=1 Tax=Candolleomyces aberdarensis TaxID=2316362 RepID=A0A4Q2DRN5_9AGAR|nr:hypothetical protein EST38_g4178 [Candolleomyces aberdarensis]